MVKLLRHCRTKGAETDRLNLNCVASSLLYPKFLVLFLGIWFYIQFFSGVMSLSQHSQVGGIAWWVHIGGFIAGALLSVVFVKRRDA